MSHDMKFLIYATLKYKTHTFVIAVKVFPYFLNGFFSLLNFACFILAMIEYHSLNSFADVVREQRLLHFS